jgi:hypothetical protein
MSQCLSTKAGQVHRGSLLLCSALDIRLDFALVQSVHAHAARDML